MLVSDQLRERQTKPIASGAAHLEARVFNNPVEVAARQYIKDDGVAAYSNAVVEMLNRTLARVPRISPAKLENEVALIAQAKLIASRTC